MDKETKPAIEVKLQGIMEYYVKLFFEECREKYKDELAKHNPGFIDPEILDISIDQYIDAVIEETTEKFHTFAYMLLNIVASGGEGRVREFELLFIDLVKRTLLQGMKEERQPISIIIEDPTVKAEE